MRSPKTLADMSVRLGIGQTDGHADGQTDRIRKTVSRFECNAC